MNKKILISVGVIIAGIAGVVAMSAYEAHVINVTAHIENALSVDTTPIEFGTVFPQEYLEKTLTVTLSDSFLGEVQADDVEYIIKQKPKCICEWDPQLEPDFFDIYCEGKMYVPINYATHQCPAHYHEMLSLCPFLSKTDGDLEDNNDIGVPSYYQGTSCSTPNPEYAMGRLAKSENDTSDTWIIDLKVPPVTGYVGQDWPAGCPVVDEDSKDYGCDLWIEVTGISRFGEENGSEKERTCIASGGTMATSTCCLATGDFPGTCQTGACGCSPENSHEVKVCECGAGECFNGTTCVDKCSPITEVCNGIDDDCDLLTDEGALWENKGESCSVGVGECQATGVYACDSNPSAPTICSATAGTPNPEICDSLDNDCDGEIDEGDVCSTPVCTFLETQPCDTQLLGVCAAGTQTCDLEGFWGSCVQDEQSSPEICDNLDNDCDGVTDENLIQSCSLQLGVCSGITQSCSGGVWATCDYGPYYEAGTELTCDGKDNDCDGQVDEDCPAPNGWLYEQNFNSLTDSNLNGQDSWIGSTRFDVQGSTVYEGAKAVSIAVGESGAGYVAERSITGVSAGTVYVAMRRDDTVIDYSQFSLKQGATEVMKIVFRGTNTASNDIMIYEGGVAWQAIVTGYNVDQWYVIAIEFDDSAQDNKYRAKVHDGASWTAWTDWYATVNAYTEIGTIEFFCYAGPGNSYNAYFDTITPNDPTTP